VQTASIKIIDEELMKNRTPTFISTRNLRLQRRDVGTEAESSAKSPTLILTTQKAGPWV